MASLCSVVNRRVLSLLEELKVLVQSSILLQQQLLTNQFTGVANASIEDDFAIPLMTLQQLEKLETDCQDRELRGKLVGPLCFNHAQI